MDITVQDINSVDKEIVISANREDLKSKFEEAYKKYQGKIDMPGFRPGKVPISIVKKRFGKEIEYQEIEKFLQEVFENRVVPEHEPVGETQMVDLTWEDDELEAKFRIGSKPAFELVDLDKIKVDRMVHDVTDEEVDEEIDRILEQQGSWEEVDEPVTESSRVTIDAQALDQEGEPIEGDREENQALDLRQEQNQLFRKELLGKKVGDIVDIEIGEEETQKFRLFVKKVEKLNQAELTEDFVKEQTDGEMETVDEYKSLVKSRIQSYYDQVSEDMLKNELVEEMVGAHDFEVPEVFLEQIKNQYVERVKQKNEGELPPDFDPEEYKENIEDRAERDAKWFFINEKLQEKFDDIEIKPDDIDEYLEMEAARYGISVDQMRNLFAQNPQQLESLRNSIRENKVFDRLMEEVKLNDISKKKYQKKHDKKVKAREKAAKKK
ncbi:MAG: trigger factor [Balneolaceae bacterium]|nr:trigger factor [Balneolaceae bacterium]